MSVPKTSEKAQRNWNTNGAGLGFIAVLAMLAVQLLWRLVWSPAGVPSFPEILVTVVARLTPYQVFGAATENLGSLAKRSLFVAVIIGIIWLGAAVGSSAGRLVRQTRGRVHPLAAGFGWALALWLISTIILFPLANLGLFALASSHTSDIMTQTTITFALYALVWAGLMLWSSPIVAPHAGGVEVDRRSVLRETVFGLGTLAGVLAVGRQSWLLMRGPTSPSEPVAAGPTTAQIVAQQRQLQAAAQSVATPTAAPGAVNFDVLQKNDGLTSLVTATKDFYHVSKNIYDPSVSSDGWSLTIDGLVSKKITLNYDQLTARATTKKITTLQCISNELNGDLISTGEWTGTPLAELLKEAGVDVQKTKDLKLKAADDYEESFPLAVGLDPDTLVVTGLNGQPLGHDHGYPARLIVPGIYGMKNVKWIEHIQAIDSDFQGFWEDQGWSDSAICQIWGRIDYPSSGAKLPAGSQIACGVASAGDRGISRVEVSFDKGSTWTDAKLEPALNPPFTWVRWALPFSAAKGDHTITIRVTDGKGAVMDEKNRAPLPNGATGWPKRSFSIKGE